MNRLFRIGSSWLLPPSNYQEEERAVVGYDLTGRPVLQGYPTITFIWDIMRQSELTDLLAVYDPTDPKVNVTYIDKASGELTINSGMMHPVIIGQRGIVYYFNVALRVSRLDDPLP